MASKKDYFGWPRALSIILCIIPVTSWILGIIVRCTEKKFVAGLVVRLLLGFTVLWISDIICLCVQKKIIRIMNV